MNYHMISFIDDIDLYTECSRITDFYRLINNTKVINIFVSETLTNILSQYLLNNEYLAHVMLVMDINDYTLEVGNYSNFIILCIDSEDCGLLLHNDGKCIVLYPNNMVRFVSYPYNSIDIKNSIATDSKYNIIVFFISRT
ncbi:hypothetical protein V_blen_00037 [Fowlpox virus]|nr:hypothetical protein V_blen_00037 [Fowlpox virus]URH28158.1 hypothetical protein V_cmp_00037 [Fowlpox virus]URH28417.1 hypothetical protein V_ds_00037 [Fowlpox virus]URH28676.1 hypothetical protein V_kr_00038 [Fowlpox virus]